MGSPKNSQDATNPPPPPEPSNDTGIIPAIQSPLLEDLDSLTLENVDIFTLDPVAALKLLCRSVQLLVEMTGDVPPTPATHGPDQILPPMPPREDKSNSAGFSSRNQDDHLDGVPFQRTPIGSPEAHMHEPIVHGSTSQPPAIQYAALVRKFYSKRPPPISLEDYLTRMHKYCPMSTAVYLATSYYITRLTLKEKICVVTPRNAHRLVLAGLRVAMKALEDLSWPHGRFAKVGGISEPELARLEVAFCFLMDFGLKVDAQMLTEEVHYLVRSNSARAVVTDDADTCGFQLRMPEPKSKGPPHGSPDPRSAAEMRKASSGLSVRAYQPMGQGIGIVGQS